MYLPLLWYNGNIAQESPPHTMPWTRVFPTIMKERKDLTNPREHAKSYLAPHHPDHGWRREIITILWHSARNVKGEKKGSLKPTRWTPPIPHSTRWSQCLSVSPEPDRKISKLIRKHGSKYLGYKFVSKVLTNDRIMNTVNRHDYKMSWSEKR